MLTRAIALFAGCDQPRSPDNKREPAPPAAQPSSAVLVGASAWLNPAEIAQRPTYAPAFEGTAIVGLSQHLQTAVNSWWGCVNQVGIAVVICCRLLFWQAFVWNNSTEAGSCSCGSPHGSCSGAARQQAVGRGHSCGQSELPRSHPVIFPQLWAGAPAHSCGILLNGCVAALTDFSCAHHCGGACLHYAGKAKKRRAFDFMCEITAQMLTSSPCSCKLAGSLGEPTTTLEAVHTCPLKYSLVVSPEHWCKVVSINASRARLNNITLAAQLPQSS